MKKTILITLLVIVTALIITKVYAYCMVDWKCQFDCFNAGYNYELCKQVCTYCNY